MATRSRKNRPTESAYKEGRSRADEAALERVARRTIKRKSWWAAGVGLIPVPLVDFVGATAVQLSLLHELCYIYDVPYSEDRGREWIGALVGGLTPTLVKAIPGLGSLVGVLTGPAYYGASTYAIGRVFMQHFETGGTFLSFEPERMRSHFNRYFREGRDEVSEARTAA